MMDYLTMKDFLEKRKLPGVEATVLLEPTEIRGGLELPVAQKATVLLTKVSPKEEEKKEKDPLKRATFLSKLGNIEFNPRELVDDWILITYDIPATEEGNIARQKFLKMAPKMGAVMHTKSVYLMPNTNECQLATLELSKIGKVYVWYSRAKDEHDKKELTELYDARIGEMVDDLRDRLARTQKHIKDDKKGISERMMDGNEKLFESIVFSVCQRGDKALYNKLESIHNRIEELKLEL